MNSISVQSFGGKAQPQFDTQAYWSTRRYKSWVVFLTSTKGTGRNKTQRSHVMYVRASNSQIAIATAKRNTFLTGRLSGHCRLATPTDLGCVASTPREAA